MKKRYSLPVGGIEECVENGSMREALGFELFGGLKLVS
jgi:hypothetical protein